jgi:NTP pyrophosphatase (non-canonical NTP hydrolase)
MTFQQITTKAIEIRRKYANLEKDKYGKSWSGQDLMSGFVGDVGDLSKLIQAKSGTRNISNVDEKLKHELADCLWSVIAIADAYDVDLEKSFTETMDKLEEKLDE